MSKGPPVDLMALTSLTTDEAAPMPEAPQRSTSSEKAGRGDAPAFSQTQPVRRESLVDLNFKVPTAFGKSYRLCAVQADLKQNELLFELLAACVTERHIGAWEKQHKSKL